MYVSPNCQTKKEIRTRLAAGETITVFAPGLGSVPHNGECFIEGPHYPQPHKWYGTAVIKNGVVVKVK